MDMDNVPKVVPPTAPVTALTTPPPGNGHDHSGVGAFVGVSQQAGQQGGHSFHEGGFTALATALEKVIQYDNEIASLRRAISNLQEQLHESKTRLIAGQAERDTARQEADFLLHQLQQGISQRLDFPAQVGTTNS